MWSPRRYFYPRSPCGERLGHRGLSSLYSIISIHALLAESDEIFSRSLMSCQFLSTLSLRRATTYPSQCRTLARDFYPRSPCGERPFSDLVIASDIIHFYPRSPCGERRRVNAFHGDLLNISIHALLAESDVAPVGLNLVGQIFLSTLSLRRATWEYWVGGYGTAFLSTLSLRRATARSRCQHGNGTFLSTLSLRRATFRSPRIALMVGFLSTLSLRRATRACYCGRTDRQFLSTLSLRRATRPGIGHICARRISIHALLAESDLGDRTVHQVNQQFLSTLSLRRATLFLRSDPMTRPYFYPRSPCGERRRLHQGRDRSNGYFYPRSPCGERHRGQNPAPPTGTISIHALLAESDIRREMSLIRPYAFLSTLSLRRATWLRCWQLAARDISIHALLAESDPKIR